jgi:hypothetical protein
LVTDLNTLANFNPIVPNDFKDAQVVIAGQFASTHSIVGS